MFITIKPVRKTSGCNDGTFGHLFIHCTFWLHSAQVESPFPKNNNKMQQIRMIESSRLDIISRVC